MSDANFIHPEKNCVVKCYDKRQSLGVLIVKFRTCEEANLACHLEDVKFLSSMLRIVKYCQDNENNDIEGTSQHDAHCSIFSDKGRLLIYIQMLVRHRDSFPKSGSHDPVLEIIRQKLLKKGVQASLAELRIFRQNLQKHHRNRKRDGKTSHDLHVPCSVIFDGADKKMLEGTAYDPNADEGDKNSDGETTLNSKLVKFSNVASWSTASSLALVSILNDNKEEFFKPIRRSTFWKEVSNIMVKDAYFYTPEQCENRLEKGLKPMFKDFMELDHSGAPAPWLLVPQEGTKEMMKLMHQFMGKCVSVEPKKTFAAGFMAQEKRAQSSESSPGAGARRPGLARPTVLKRKQTLAERKVAALERKASALETFGIAISQSHQNKKF